MKHWYWMNFGLFLCLFSHLKCSWVHCCRRVYVAVSTAVDGRVSLFILIQLFHFLFGARQIYFMHHALVLLSFNPAITRRFASSSLYNARGKP